MPRPRFTLRALFVVMTLLCVWCAYSLNWIQHRPAAMTSRAYLEDSFALAGTRTSPGMVWLFGEEGYEVLCFDPRKVTEEERARITALFPEAWAYDLPDAR
jgi:hypothetical protein